MTPTSPQSTTSGISITLLTQAVRIALQLGSIVVLARLLDPADFGLVAMVTAFLVLAEIFRDFGLFSAAIQAPRLSPEQRDNLFWINSVIGALCVIIFWACAPAIAAFYEDDRLEYIVVCLAPIFLLNGMATQYRASLNREMRFSALSASDLSSQVAGIAVAVSCALVGAGYWSLVAQQLVASLVVLIVTVMLGRWLPGLPKRRAPMGQLLTFGRQLLGSRVAIYLPTNIDNVVIGATAGAFAVGLYSRAYQLVSMPLNYVSSPLMRVALPVLAQAAGSEEFERLTLRFQMLICYVSGTIFAVLAGLAEPLTLLLFGPSWEAAAPLVMLLALGGIFRALTVLCDWTLQAKGSTATQFRYTAIAAPIWVVAIAASAIGGAAAVAVATSTAAALFWVVYIRAATKSLSFTPGRMLRHSLARLAALPLPIFMTTWLTAQSSYGPVAQVLLGSGIALAAGACLAACVPMVRRDLRSVRRRRLSRTEHSSAAASDQRQER